VARKVGLRDSTSLFTKTPSLAKLSATVDDRDYLTSVGLLAHQLKHREIGLVTARSIFKQFGYRIIRKGKRIRDDYDVGDRNENDLASDDEEMQDNEDEIDDEEKGTSDTKTGREPLLRPSEATPRFQRSSIHFSKHLPWIHRAAASAAEFNSRLRAARQEQFFDIHTNQSQVRKATHPSHLTVELKKGSWSLRKSVDSQVILHTNNSSKLNWVRGDLDSVFQYPIALLEGQFQAGLPMYAIK